jgi:hypothetical protein
MIARDLLSQMAAKNHQMITIIEPGLDASDINYHNLLNPRRTLDDQDVPGRKRYFHWSTSFADMYVKDMLAFRQLEIKCPGLETAPSGSCQGWRPKYMLARMMSSASD